MSITHPRRRSIYAAMIGLVVTGGLGIGVTSASAAPTPLVGAGSNRCLDVNGGVNVQGAALQIWDCNGQSNQAFELTSSGELRVFNGAACVDAENAGTAAGTRAIIWACNGQNNQKWRQNSDGTIASQQSGLCLDVTGAGTAAGTAVVLWTCSGQNNQRWSATGSGGPTTPPTTPPGSTCNVAPVDPQATAAARRLLCYLYSQYGNHILSGQQESTWIGGPEYEMNYINQTTGKYPAIRGLDMGDSPDFGARAAAWWNAGGIPMVGYHMGSPALAADGYDSSRQRANINAALTSGTVDNQRLHQRLDGVAAQLNRVSGGAVIFRPFHEAGGNWFWWSMEGGAQYNRLWQYTFNYLTRTKGLHHLVWLHGYNGQPNSAFYPGKQYVDIGGADTYAGDGNYDPQLSMYNSSRNIYGSTLPIALHENGPIPDPDRLQSTGARWVLFGTWHGNHLTVSNSQAHLRKVYGHSYVVTRDEVPNLRS